ncbi:MAG: DUF3141 domain-containing protein, partial [Polyangia bacterium]|jgi:hypothetical protein|nr:DUF3141 domain-containing protein [Polyangia bacterium]
MWAGPGLPGFPFASGGGAAGAAPWTQVFDAWQALWKAMPGLSAMQGFPGLGGAGSAGAAPFAAAMEAWLASMKSISPMAALAATGIASGGGADATQATSEWQKLAATLSQTAWERSIHDGMEYALDFVQRVALYMDTLRQRGNVMLEHYEAGMPPLLAYEYDVVLDARTFQRPANYQLLHIKHPEGKEPAPGRRPLVIIDPRAGHGPGIGGFKQESEVGMGLTEGHPVYFVSFTPEPCPGQTLEDVELAEVRFIEEVNRRHPDRDVPLVYGNCQAGWAVAMLGADRPDVTGPIVINGAPMSYWAGEAKVNPMRLTGGLTGGAWVTRLTCDLAGGIFDGAHLVANFENLNPANTLWSKEYNLFSNIDKEPPRYLEFERWWTGFFLMNEAEILWIVNNLFIGDHLEKGEIVLGPDHRVNMRNLEDPLVIFASGGDNITPPHQALHWISELYATTEELKAAKQRFVYLLNPHIGHLGIFVSAKVAQREHRAIIEHIENIRALEPGLYQMIIDEETGEPDPLKDQFIVHFEERDIKDVRFPVESDAFGRMAAVSKANEALYLNYGRPLVRALTAGWPFELMRWLHPARTSRYLLSDRVSPSMGVWAPLAAMARSGRRPVGKDNLFLELEKRLSDAVVSGLDAFRDGRDNALEAFFTMLYGT